MKTRYEQIKELYAALGFPFYEGSNTVNLYGIRQGYDVVNLFDDPLGLAVMNESGEPICLEHAGTTKPGLYWLKNKMGSVNGTFILEQGYYKHCWLVRKHRGQYEALCQVYSYQGFWGVRDNNSDGLFDIEGLRVNNVTGLNMHHARDKMFVGPYSAACQARQHDEDHFEMMEIVNACLAYWNATKVSYALFDLAIPETAEAYAKIMKS